MHERIKQARLAKKMTQAELAQQLGVTPQSVQQWETSTEPRKNRVMKIAEILSVDAEWLLFGTAKKDGVPAKDFKSREVDTWDSKTPLNDDEVEIPYYKSIELAAGNGSNGGSDNNGYKLRFSKSTLKRYGISAKDVASFPVHGDSMEPVIPSGTTVFVNMGDKTIVDGGIYFIEQEDLLRVKILLRQPGGKLTIRSYNSIDYPDETIDIEKVRVVGRVFNMSVMLI
ncbi:XRE family transcriptional regulator [Providencia rettgeri]|uniref:XRE family transcriptional regulator n=1 Tax=Providencia rettgeri TaxID=587 RepID=UPI0001C34989|nr:helix-turn-helix transcriptional regulator [Providencia rettgeri]